MEEFNEYFYSKFYQCLLYDEEIYNYSLKGKYDFYIFNSTFFEVFINLSHHLIKLDVVEESIKDKIHSLISYIRNKAIYDDSETKKYYYDLFNKLIISLNINKFNDGEEFYLHEIAKRFNCIGKKINSNDFENKKEFVKRSLGYDFIFLLYHTDEVDEETFDKSIYCLLNDEYYFASLNAILYEYPELLKNETFKRRVKKVIELNKKSSPLLLDKSFLYKIYILKNTRKYSSL